VVFVGGRIQEEHAVMAMTLNAADSLLLLNVANQGVHLWDVRARALVRRFRGLSQGHFTIHACFGGAHHDFIASGSEDNKVRHALYGTPFPFLSGEQASNRHFDSFLFFFVTSTIKINNQIHIYIILPVCHRNRQNVLILARYDFTLINL
jgi:hypothetical protein